VDYDDHLSKVERPSHWKFNENMHFWTSLRKKIEFSQSQTLKIWTDLSASINLALSNFPARKFSNFQSLKLSQALMLPNSQTLELAKAQTPKFSISQTRNSQPQNLSIKPSNFLPLKLARSQTLNLPNLERPATTATAHQYLAARSAEYSSRDAHIHYYKFGTESGIPK